MIYCVDTILKYVVSKLLVSSWAQRSSPFRHFEVTEVKLELHVTIEVPHDTKMKYPQSSWIQIRIFLKFHHTMVSSIWSPSLPGALDPLMVPPPSCCERSVEVSSISESSQVHCMSNIWFMFSGWAVVHAWFMDLTIIPVQDVNSTYDSYLEFVHVLSLRGQTSRQATSQEKLKYHRRTSSDDF